MSNTGKLAAVDLQLLAAARECEHQPLGPCALHVPRLNAGREHGEGQWPAAGLPFHRRAGDLQVSNGPVLLRLAPQREGDRPAAQHLTPALTDEDVLQFYVAQLRLALSNQVADDEVALATLHDQLRQVLSLGWRLALLRLGDGRRNLGLTLLFGFARGHRAVLHRGRGVVSATSVGSSADSMRPPEEAHAEQSRRARSGSAVEALRETRTEELRNVEAGGRNDIVVR